MSGLRVGVTIGLYQPDEAVWNNGIKQNAVFLVEALRHCPGVESAILVNTTAVPITSALPWDLKRWPTLPFDDAKDRLDVLVELGGQINAAQTDYLKQRGVRLVSYCCGFEYIHTAEAIMFGRSMWGRELFVNRRYDDLWFIPQVASNTKSYLEVVRRISGRVVPFVWSPVFLERRARGLAHGGVYRASRNQARPDNGAARRGMARRLAIMEPNINIVKFCLYPILIAELAYRERPHDIEVLQVTNAINIAKENHDFIMLMNELDIVREHKAVFIGRYDTPQFLPHTDVVISHQFDNPLNYYYLEVCWQGYPLIHNASLCSDLGYYYHGNDAQQGAARLLEAFDTHDLNAKEYRMTQRDLIGRYLPDAPAVVETYQRLLDELMQRPPR